MVTYKVPAAAFSSPDCFKIHSLIQRLWTATTWPSLSGTETPFSGVTSSFASKQ
jgi:hypothetical protein